MTQNLMIFSHPNIAASIANINIINNLKQHMPDIKIHHLDKLYPNFRDLDIDAEQGALIHAKNIVLQFPFQWYSSPPALKNYLDLVLTYNFAYGPNGDKLKNKNLIVSITTGGPKEAYNALGYNHFKIDDFLLPFEQTAYLCGMNYQTPIISHNCSYQPEIKDSLDQIHAITKQHAILLKQSLDKLI